MESTHETYLTDIAQSYFTVSPVGNGEDCHKTWEVLYMRSIPIVTRWFGVEKFKSLGIPMIILDDWSEFKDLDLCKDRYLSLWKDFKTSSLNFELFK